MIRQQSILSGVQKQSVEDVDRSFSQLLIDWMKQKGYTDEATYFQVVRNWRRACDKRGLTDNQRNVYNKEF